MLIGASVSGFVMALLINWRIAWYIKYFLAVSPFIFFVIFFLVFIATLCGMIREDCVYHYSHMAEYGQSKDIARERKFSRMAAFLIFEQFKYEIMKKFVKKIKKQSAKNNEIIEKAKKSFEPLIPYLVADELYKDFKNN